MTSSPYAVIPAYAQKHRHPGVRRDPEGRPLFRRTPEPINPASDQLRIQITPLRIAAFDQVELPPALPFLDRLLSGDCRKHRRVRLEPNQVVHAMPPRKATGEIVLVLPHAREEV